MTSLSDLHRFEGNDFSCNTALPIPPMVHYEKGLEDCHDPDSHEANDHLRYNRFYSSMGDLPSQYYSLDHYPASVYQSNDHFDKEYTEYIHEETKRQTRSCSNCATVGTDMPLSSDDQNEFNFDPRDLLGFYDEFSSLEYPDVFDEVIERPHFSYQSPDHVGKSNSGWLTSHRNNPIGIHKHRGAANKRERRRMQIINAAFEKLRKHVPCIPYEKKLSKVDTLKSAIDYIKFMSRLLKTNENSSGSQKPRKNIVVLCKKEGNSENKSEQMPEIIGHSLSWSWDNSHSDNEQENKEELKLPLLSGKLFRGQLNDRKRIKAPVWRPIFPGNPTQNNIIVQEKSFSGDTIPLTSHNEGLYCQSYGREYTRGYFNDDLRYADYTENRMVVSPLTEAMRIIVSNQNEVESEIYSTTTVLPPVSSLITNEPCILGQYPDLVNNKRTENVGMISIHNGSPIEHLKISKNSSLWHNMQFPMQLTSIHPLFVK